MTKPDMHSFNDQEETTPNLKTLVYNLDFT